VAPEDKSFALGIQFMLFRVLGKKEKSIMQIKAKIKIRGALSLSEQKQQVVIRAAVHACVKPLCLCS